MNPYLPVTQNDGLGQAIGRLAVATIVPVFGLFVLRLVLASLPMIKNAAMIGDLGVTPLVLVKAAIDTVIYFLVIRFGMASSQEIKGRRPHLAEIATVIVLTCAALVATLAYSGYEVLMASVAPMQMEVYNWVFLAVVLAPIVGIVVIVTRRLDFFTNLLFGKLNEVSGPVAFAAAPMAAAAAAAPQGLPSMPPPPAASNPAAVSAFQERLQGVAQKVTAAAAAAQKMQEQGQLKGELAEAASKMQGYLNGARQSLASQDLDRAKGFADWAEYEAGRVLAAVK